MKNLPESELWNRIKSRLETYTEAPQDDWDEIMKAIPRQGGSSDAATKVLRSLLFLLLGWLIFPWVASIRPQMLHPHSGIAKVLFYDQDTITLKTNDAANNVIPSKPTARIDEQKRRYDNSRVGTHRQASRDNSRDNTSGNSASVNFQIQNAVSPQSDVFSSGVNNEQSAEMPGKSVHPIGTITSKFNIDSVEDVSVASDTAQVKSTASDKAQRKSSGKLHFVYVSVTPSLAFYKLSPDKNDDVQMLELRKKGIFSSNRFGISVDIGVRKPITPDIEWYGGLNYYQQQQDITYTYVSDNIGTIESENGGDHTITPEIKTMTVSYSMRNVGLSSGFFYTLKDATLTHQAGVGLQYHYNISSGNSETSSRRKAQSQLMYQFSYRLKWNFARNIDFYIQPQYSHALLKEKNENYPFTIKPSRAGVGIGFIYRMN